MDVIPGCKPCLEPAFEARHRFEAEGGGQRAGFEALPVVLADDQDLPVARKLCRPRAQRLTRQAQGVRDVAPGEIEWRAHIHDLNVAVLHFFAPSEAVMLWNDRCWPTSPVTRVLPCRSPKRNC